MVTNKKRKELPLPEPMVLVRHSLDFLESSVRLLQTPAGCSQQQIREIVVLLAIGAEQLLKSRLMTEDWSLVFERPEEADREKLFHGTLRSVAGGGCLPRLEKTCGLVVDAKTKRAFERLWSFRNQLVHCPVRIQLNALVPLAFEVLSSVVDLSEGWLPVEAKDQRERLAASLRTLAPFRSARHSTISSALNAFGTASFYCPKCEERTIIHEDGERRCMFCTSVDEIFQDISDVHLRNEADGGTAGDIATCMRCDSWYAAVLERRGGTIVRCLQCWEPADKSTLRHCVACDHWLIPPVGEGSHIACPDCSEAVGLK